MKQVKVLGTGCANCRATAQRVEEVARKLGVPITSGCGRGGRG